MSIAVTAAWIDAQHERVARLRTQISVLRADIAALRRTIATLEGDIDRLHARLAAAEAPRC